MQIYIDIKLGKVDSMIQRWKQLEALKQAVGEASLYVRGKVSEYPRVQRRRMIFRTARQRRAFFAKLKSGEIEVPYRRGSSPNSETMGRRWNVDRSPDGLSARVGNNVSYARYVVGEKQAEYHRGNWKKTSDVVREETPHIQAIFDKNIRSAL